MNTNITFLLKPNSVGFKVERYDQVPAYDMFTYSKTFGIWGFVGKRVWHWPAQFLLHLILLIVHPKDFIVPEVVEVPLSW